MQDDGRIDLAQEFFRRDMIGRHDRIGVVRAVALDMGDRLVDPVDHLGGDDRVEIFGRPILLGRRPDARIGGLRVRIAAHLAARIDQHADQRRKQLRRDRAVDQQRLGGAANPGAPHLGVENDRLGHSGLGALVDIDVAIAVEMGEHRHTRLGLHAGDEILPSARDDHVDRAREPLQHQPDRGAVAGRNELNRVPRQPGGPDAVDERRMNGPRRAEAVRAPAQDDGVAGLQAKRGGVGGDVRPALVNHADHAERRPHPLDSHPVGPVPGVDHGADGVLKTRNHVDAFGHRGDALLVEHQTIDEGGGRPAAARLGDVLGIGRKNCGCGRANGLPHRLERRVLVPGGGERKLARGRPRPAADIGHDADQVAAGFHSLQGHAHRRHSLVMIPS